jgi:hypothetical protein
LAEAGRGYDTILLMMRRVTYRSALTAFVFTGLWFVLGLLLLWSPIPGSLGIRAEMLVAWLMLFLLIMASAGATLTLASYNDMFPPDEEPAPKRLAAPVAAIPADPAVTPDGRPLPWTESPLPTRPARRTSATTSTAARPSRPDSPPARGR